MVPSPQILSEDSLLRAIDHLSAVDKTMAKLIATHKNCTLLETKYLPFHTLVNSIIGQQLSSRAATTIRSRILEIASSPFIATNLLKVQPHRLRKAGLSRSKVKYILGLSRHVAEGQLDFSLFGNQDDEAVIEALTSIPGIGRWTAEMFLIFGLKRPDVMALNDSGLRRSIKILYGEKSSPEKLSKRWRPYCSIASWYLWRHLDEKPLPSPNVSD